jgi:Kef-type K+ transport system membrane component KefB
MEPLWTILLCVGIANAAALILKRLFLPHVVVLIFVGLFLGLPIIRPFIISGHEELIMLLGDIGIISAMFIAGLRSSSKMLSKEEHDSLILGIFSTLTPFFITYVLFMILGFSVSSALIIAICMSITAEATNAEVLLYLKRLRTKIGSLIIETGLLDDIFGIFVFLMVSFTMKLPLLKDQLLLISVLLAFFLGIVFQKIFNKYIIETIEQVALFAIVPFFFISMGLHFDMSALALNLSMVVFVTSIAIIGKLVGTLLSKKFVNLQIDQLYLVGWAMNSRGAMELAIALIAFRNALIPLEIYSSLVMMTIITTVLFPVIVSFMIKQKPRIMSM